MKRLLALCLLIPVLLCAAPAAAEIYIDREPPESWNGKDLLVLTAFQAPMGDSALLQVGGLDILIDGGFKGARYDMEKTLADLGLYDGIDYIWNSHPHDDHIGAVIHMMRYGFTFGEFISTFPEDYPDDELKYAVSLMKEAGIPYRHVEQGETLELGGASFTFHYFPDGHDPNALSGIALITFGRSTLLMTGDITNASMRWLHANLAEGKIRADIMKFPHHGILPAEKEFLDDVGPQFVYVTNHKSNTLKTNAQLNLRRIPCKYTRTGRIVMTTDGTDWYIMQYPGMY